MNIIVDLDLKISGGNAPSIKGYLAGECAQQDDEQKRVS